MVPTAFVCLDALPLTPTGKIDRKALPAPSGPTRADFVAPRNATEATLVEIWKRILELETISIHDNFFDLGGHSLLATRLISQMRAEMNVECRVGDLLEYSTVAALAGRIAAMGAVERF